MSSNNNILLNFISSVGTGNSVYDLYRDTIDKDATALQFLEAMRIGKDGEQGPKGEDGKSAYEIWLELGNEGSEEDFINSLKGKDAESITYTNEEINEAISETLELLKEA